VLNPFGAPACPDGFTEYRQDIVPGEEPVWINKAHGEYLRALAVEYELTWVSGWAEDPNLLCPLLGIERLERVPMPPIPFDPELKVQAVAAFVDDDRAVAWIDDALGDSARSWAAARSAPTLLVDVDPAVGLTVAAVATLFEWVGSLTT
jgi:hypothetical protein